MTPYARGGNIVHTLLLEPAVPFDVLKKKNGNF
jgi:hypothetical protein